MRTLAIGLLMAGLAAAADPPKQRPKEGNLKVGDVAPAFELKLLGEKKSVKLADLKGKPVVLVFGSCT